MARIPRKIVVASAIVGVGALGIGVAGAVGGIPVSPGPSDHADSHPAPQATTVTLPDAAYAGSGNAAVTAPPSTPPGTDAPSAGDAAPTSPTTGAPGIGEAPSESNLATALDSTGSTPGNTVLNDLITTAPGPDRGSTISGDARSNAPTPTVPDTVPSQATSHMP